MLVARAGPDEDVPPSLRPFLRFKKLPAPAVEAARSALDDESFRQRVRDAVRRVVDDPDAPEMAVDEIVGEVGALALERPDGWSGAVEDAMATARDEAATAADRREERRARRRLEAAEAARRRSEAAREQALAELDDERRRRRAAEDRAEELAERVAALREVDEGRAEAVRQLKEAEQRVAERALELRRLRAQLGELRQELVEARAGAAAEVPDVPSDGVARRRVVDELGRVASAAGALVDAVAAASSALGVDEVELARASTPGPCGPEGLDGTGATTGAEAGHGPGRGAGTRRRAELPPGVFDDSVEAALHLLRLPAAVLVVDGYNVSLEGWPDEPLPAQRRRLVDALRNLQARTGVEPIVVFDGVEAEGGPAGSLPRSVQVRFSPPGVTADDVVVELVGQLPEDRPVVVASSDGELRERSVAAGANTVGSGQLLDVLRAD